jgi:hypothetical protein
MLSASAMVLAVPFLAMSQILIVNAVSNGGSAAPTPSGFGVDQGTTGDSWLALLC